MRYLKGQTWSKLKAGTGIIDRGAKTRISVEQRAKALVFLKKKHKVFTPGNRAEMSNLEVNCSMNVSCMHVVSVHRKQ